MKTSIAHSRFQLPAAARQLSNTRRGHSRPTRHASGVALVVTLIMLSVITFMAIALLVLSRAEHGSVATETEQTQARLAAETGLQRAIAQALGPVMAQNNEFKYDLLVSTNFINPLGFTPGVANATNVNYDYRVDGKVLNLADRNQNINNLWIDPRPPVFVTNRFSALGGSEFRFFLNLNRNTNVLGPIFDPTGWLPVTNNGAVVTMPPNNTPVFSYFVGDPQWVGILSSPDRPHAPDNRFISRFAYLLVPASKTLDLNSVHNYAKVRNLGLPMQGGDGFLRNQGVGPWEGNLAAFLVDLNTNLWPYPDPSPGGPTYPPAQPYFYNFANAVANTGAAFDDALSVVRYRYAFSAGNLPPVSQLFGPGGTWAFRNDFIDAYLTSRPDWLTWPPPLMTDDPDVVPLTGTPMPWAGADNTNHFFTTQEVFDRSKFLTPGFPTTTPTIADRLLGAGNNTQSSYDQYTFYRMLSQLGSDTAGDAGRINLNYCNLDNQGHVVPNMETNFLPWIPEHFFTNTANALLRSYGYNFTITNIQIYPTNFYTPNVHRLLQLAANIYDASTNQLGTNNLPTVFRPYFRQVVFPGGVHGVMIAGYREATNDVVARLNANFPGGPLTAVLGYNQATLLPLYGIGDRGDTAEPQVQGIPLIIGAKKGLPNFNEYAMQTQVTVTRKLQFRRQGTSNTSPIVETNQMYLVSITNTFGLEAWNSYFSAYPRKLQVRMDAVMLAVVTNEYGNLLLSNAVPFQPVGANIAAGQWQGYGFPVNDTTPYSFRAVTRSFLFLTNSMYSDSRHIFETPGDYERGNGFPVPHWYLSLRPMVRMALVDTTVVPNRIVDYVSLDSHQVPTDLTPLLTGSTGCGNYYTERGDPGAMWCTNRINSGVSSPTYGILNQITVALGNKPSSAWNQNQHAAEVDFFRAQFGLGMLTYPDGTFSMTNTFQAPYASSRIMNFYNSLQANDPLVHYTVPDLVDQLSSSTNLLAGGIPYELDTTYSSAMKALGGLDLYSNNVPVGAWSPVNPHYRPWGGNPDQSGDTSPVATNWRLEVKDPLVTRSDAWDFPTNKYPNIGWLGRVHRGTPWQTVYLKATTNDWTRWQYWSGDTATALYYDAKGNTLGMPDHILSLPEGDRVILDLFSTAINDNAARGRLSINQEGLAAWSAVLSGVAVVTNATIEKFLLQAGRQPQMAPLSILPLPQVIPPAGQFNPFLTPTNLWPAVARIVNGINTARAYHPDFRAVWWNYHGTNAWTNTFEHLGDVLAVPELTVASPFLNQGSMINPFISGLDKPQHYTLQQSVGITEEMYERIPQQILGLLHCDHTPRFVIYAYGQALKPAEHSIVTGGPFFQLCTNYQVTAEAATRAVVRIEGAPANPHAVIESFNVLPPD